MVSLNNDKGKTNQLITSSKMIINTRIKGSWLIDRVKKRKMLITLLSNKKKTSSKSGCTKIQEISIREILITNPSKIKEISMPTLTMQIPKRKYERQANKIEIRREFNKEDLFNISLLREIDHRIISILVKLNKL